MPNERPSVIDHKEIAKEFQLTNTEWLRYRLSSALPDRAEFALHQRFIDQTALQFTQSEHEIKKPAIDSATFASHTLSLGSYIDFTLDSRVLSTEGLKTLQTELARYQNYDVFHDEASMDSEEYKSLMGRAPQWKERFLDSTNERELSLQEQALQISILFHLETLEDQYGNRKEFFIRLRSALSGYDFPLLRELLLLNDDIAGSIVVRDLAGRFGKYQPSYQKKGAPLLLAPLLIHARSAVQDDGNYAGLSFLAPMINILTQELLKHPDDRKLIPDEDFNPDLAADEIFKGYIDILKNSSKQQPIHNLLSDMLNLLENLYLLGDQKTILPLDDIYQFLQEMYYRKIGKFVSESSNKYVPEQHKDLVALAGALNLDMTRITAISSED